MSQPTTHAHLHAGIQASHAQTAADAHFQAGHAHHSATIARTNSPHDPAGMACCAMTICHPAVPVLPMEIAHAASNGPPAPGPLLCSEGDEPSPALPPPRNSQV